MVAIPDLYLVIRIFAVRQDSPSVAILHWNLLNNVTETLKEIVTPATRIQEVVKGLRFLPAYGNTQLRPLLPLLLHWTGHQHIGLLCETIVVLDLQSSAQIRLGKQLHQRRP